MTEVEMGCEFIEKVKKDPEFAYEFTYSLTNTYGYLLDENGTPHEVYWFSKEPKEPCILKEIEEKHLKMIDLMLDSLDEDCEPEMIKLIFGFLAINNKTAILEKYLEKFGSEPGDFVWVRNWTPELEKMVVDNWEKLTKVKGNCAVVYMLSCSCPRALNVCMKLLEGTRDYKNELHSLVEAGRLDDLA